MCLRNAPRASQPHPTHGRLAPCLRRWLASPLRPSNAANGLVAAGKRGPADLGLFDISNITLLADGAKWIWEEKRKHLTHANGVLDIFHNLEHFAAAGRSLYGDGTNEATTWLDKSRQVVLHGDWPEIERHITTTRESFPDSPRKQQSLDELLNYLLPHTHHMAYAQRLSGAGQSAAA